MQVTLLRGQWVYAGDSAAWSGAYAGDCCVVSGYMQVTLLRGQGVYASDSAAWSVGICR